MSSLAHQLRRSTRLLVAATLLLMLPFVGTLPRVAAKDDHSMHIRQHSDTSRDCAAICARTISLPPQTALSENENRIPDPDPRAALPYHQQQRVPYAPKRIVPTVTGATVPGRPPDIVKLFGHFLF